MCFINQKLGKKTTRKLGLLKSKLSASRQRFAVETKDLRLPKKGASRATKGTRG